MGKGRSGKVEKLEKLFLLPSDSDQELVQMMEWKKGDPATWVLLSEEEKLEKGSSFFSIVMRMRRIRMMKMKIVTFRIRKIRALNTGYALTQANVLT